MSAQWLVEASPQVNATFRNNQSLLWHTFTLRSVQLLLTYWPCVWYRFPHRTVMSGMLLSCRWDSLSQKKMIIHLSFSIDAICSTSPFVLDLYCWRQWDSIYQLVIFRRGKSSSYSESKICWQVVRRKYSQTSLLVSYIFTWQRSILLASAVCILQTLFVPSWFCSQGRILFQFQAYGPFVSVWATQST